MSDFHHTSCQILNTLLRLTSTVSIISKYGTYNYWSIWSLPSNFITEITTTEEVLFLLLGIEDYYEMLMPITYTYILGKSLFFVCALSRFSLSKKRLSPIRRHYFIFTNFTHLPPHTEIYLLVSLIIIEKDIGKYCKSHQMLPDMCLPGPVACVMRIAPREPLRALAAFERRTVTESSVMNIMISFW